MGGEGEGVGGKEVRVWGGEEVRVWGGEEVRVWGGEEVRGGVGGECLKEAKIWKKWYGEEVMHAYLFQALISLSYINAMKEILLHTAA